MVTYYNKKDLVNFGNYLLSAERAEMIKQHGNELGRPEDVTNETLHEVSHADIANWLEKIEKE